MQGGRLQHILVERADGQGARCVDDTLALDVTDGHRPTAGLERCALAHLQGGIGQAVVVVPVEAGSVGTALLLTRNDGPLKWAPVAAERVARTGGVHIERALAEQFALVVAARIHPEVASNLLRHHEGCAVVAVGAHRVAVVYLCSSASEAHRVGVDAIEEVECSTLHMDASQGAGRVKSERS